MPHRTQTVGWKEESTRFTDAFTGGDSETVYYQLGSHVEKIGFANLGMQSTAFYRGDSYDPYDRRITQVRPAAGYGYGVVSGLELMYALSDADKNGISESSGTYTLVPTEPDDGQLLTRTIREERGNASNYIISHWLGGTTKQHSMTLALGADKSAALLGQTELDFRTRATSLPFSGYSTGLTLPSSIENLHRKNSNFAFKWDVTLDGNNVYSSGGVDYASELLDWTHSIVNLNSIHEKLNQTYPEDIRRGDRVYAISFTVLSIGSKTDVFDDMITQFENETFAKDLHFKIHNPGGSGGNYIQADAKNAEIISVVQNFARIKNKEHPTYQVMVKPASMVYTFKDGVDTGFYGL